MCSAGAHYQGEVCSQTASCALTTSTTASSPEEPVLHMPAVPAGPAEPAASAKPVGHAVPAELAEPAGSAKPVGRAEHAGPAEPAGLLPCPQRVALSQLSKVIGNGMCASEAVQPPKGGTQGVGQEAAQGNAQVQGKVLILPFQSAAKQGAQTVKGGLGASNQTLSKAKLLIQSLLDPRALLEMLSINANTAQELQKHTSGTLGQVGAGAGPTPAGLNTCQGPQSARPSAAAAALGKEAAEAASEHALTNDEYVGNNHAAQEVQPPVKAGKGCQGSLMTMLGFGGGGSGSGRGANRRTSSGVCEEEEAGVKVGKLAGVALHVVELLLDAVLTRPEVSGRDVLSSLSFLLLSLLLLLLSLSSSW